MRSLIQSALCAAAMLFALSASAQFWTEDFETDGEGVRYTSTTSFYGNTGDFFVRTNGLAPATISIAEGGFYTGLSGSYVWAGEDMNGTGSDGNAFKTLEFTGIDITGISNLEFRGLFGGNGSAGFPGWDAADEFYVEYQVDGGGYTTFMQFVSTAATFNGYIQHDSDLDGTGDGVTLSAAMQEISAFISGLSGTTLDIRIYASADSSLEEFAFDHLRLFDIGAAGCTDNTACNYDAGAAVDDGSCVFPGDSCDDSDATTIQDELQGDCSCAGITPNLVITEIMYNPSDADGYPDTDYEYIEVYNAGADAVVLDNFTFTGFTMTFPANSTIAAGEYVIFALNPATYTGNGYQVFDMGGGLSNGGELLELIDDNGNTIDSVTYNDVSPWPTEADGNGPGLSLTDPSDDNSDVANWYAYCVGAGDLSGTPGAANPGPLSGCTDPTALNYEVCATIDDASCTYLFGVSDIVINELHYNPCTTQGTDGEFEFIELYNTTAGTIDIGDWYLANGISYTFPTGTMIGAGEYIIVCATAASYTGAGFQVFEWGTGQALVNTGESVNLFDDTNALIDIVAYDVVAPWPSEPNGNCNSLELIDSTSENNDGTAWQASYTFGGTPGASNSVSGGYECTDCGAGASTETVFSDDFESGIAGWTGALSAFETTTSDAITGTSLGTRVASGDGELWTALGCLNITGSCTTWNFDLKHETGWVADADNGIIVYLGSDEPATPIADGYGVTIHNSYGAGNISLVRFDFGIGTTLITAPVSLPDDQAISIEVRHLEDGTWVLLVDLDGGADSFLAAAGTAVDNTYTRLDYLGVHHFDNDGLLPGGLRLDNISITQCGVYETIYSVATGNSSDAIWNTNPAGAGMNASFSRFKTAEIQAADVVTLDADMLINDFVNQGTTDVNGQTLTVYRDFTDNGSFATSGTVMFKGDANGQIGGTSTTEFQEIILEKDPGASVSLASDASANGMIYMTSGEFDTNGQVMTLRASETSRGCIGEIHTDATWTGDITFETYIPVATEEGYFNLGNPIVGNTLAAWNDNMETTGFPGSDYPNWPSAVDPYINIYHYNETAAGDLNANGWIPASSLLNPLYTNNGYMLYLNNGSYVLDVTGGIQVGPVSDVVTHTVSTGLTDDGWNLITNPLPCAVTWNSVYSNSTGIQPQYYVKDSDGAMGYISYDYGSGTGSASEVIAAGQSIWVKAQVGGGSVNWLEQAKVSTFEALERTDNGLPTLSIQLENEEVLDYTSLFFHNEANAANDHLDGYKLYSAQPSLALVTTDGLDMMHNYISSDVENITIPVNLNIGEAFTGTVVISDAYELPEGLCMTLTDLVTGETIEAAPGNSISFETEALNEARFELNISRVVTASATDAACYNSESGTVTATSPSEVTFTWFDEMDNLIATETGTESTIENLSMGNYTVSAQDATGQCEAVTTTVWVDQPSQETLNATGHLASCNVFEGWIEVDVDATDSFYAQLTQGSDLIATGSFTEAVEFDGLEGEVYTLTVTTSCNTFTETFDLHDPEAVTLNLAPATSVVQFDGTPQTVEVYANTVNAEEVMWWINDEAAGTGAALSVSIDAIGAYEISAMAYGESCAVSDYTIIQVEQAVSVDEAEAADLQLISLEGFIQLTPQTAIPGTAEISVFNAAGQLITLERTALNGTVTLPNSGWATGVYTVRVVAGDFIWNDQFVKH